MQLKYLRLSIQYFSTRKYTGSKTKSNKFASPDDPQPNFSNVDKDLFEQYRKSLTADTIINEFRRQVFRRQDSTQLMEAQKILDRQGRQVEKMLDQGSKQQKVKIAKKMQQRFANKRNIYVGTTLKSTLSDYGDYTEYNSVKPVIKDRNLEEDEFLDVDQSHEKLYNFIDKLEDGYRQKAEVRNWLDYNTEHPQYKEMSVSTLGWNVQNHINQAYNELKLRRDHAQTQQFNKMKLSETIQKTHEYTTITRTLDPYDHGPGLNATLSPAAMDNIYELYTQGWSVRQISQRYGILPARAKFCIWARAYLWHEVLPKIGAKYYLQAMQSQDEYESGISYVDYGLDIQELNTDSNIEEITQWNPRMLDAQRKQDQFYEYKNAVDIMNRKQKGPKYEMVTVDTYGKDNYMYKLKELRIFRGKGSDEYHLKHTTFRKMSKQMRKFSKLYY